MVFMSCGEREGTFSHHVHRSTQHRRRRASSDVMIVLGLDGTSSTYPFSLAEPCVEFSRSVSCQLFFFLHSVQNSLTILEVRRVGISLVPYSFLCDVTNGMRLLKVRDLHVVSGQIGCLCKSNCLMALRVSLNMVYSPCW